jgi:Leucine-rich repeat (LRR) protein
MIQSLQPFDITDQHMRELTSQSDGLGELTELDLERSQVTAAGLTDIGRLTGLRVLNLSRMPVDAEILAQLESMSGLESLALNRSDVNDSLLAPLENLTSLRELYLNQTAVTDEGLRRLRNLINLEVIDVSSNRIDGSGFQVFRDMRDACRLREIVAHHTRFGDDGPRNIAGIETLERLALSQGGVDDSSLSSFAKCPNLIELDLSFNNISINGLRKLSRLRHVQLLRLQNNREIASSSLAAISKWDELKSLELDGTSVGLPAVRQMKELHPDLVIHWNGQEY